MILTYTLGGEVVRMFLSVTPLASPYFEGCRYVHSEISKAHLYDFKGCSKERAEEVLREAQERCGTSYGSWCGLGKTF